METVKRIVKSKGFLAFWMGALLYFLTVLPNIIHNGGIMLYLGDFRSTTLPYTYHFHDRLFELGWDWTSGLGGDYLNQYSFANLFSPFTLIYMLLPRSVLIYAIPYVYALETGVGTLLAYIYLKRFVKDSNFAVIGGLVYAFSSFAAYNLAYHFLDAIMLFPLLPIALEELCINKRKGLFALTVALLSLLNYFLFFGEVVFIIIYFFVRFADRENGFRVNMLPRVLIEAVIGFLISFIVIIPTAIMLTHSGKATDFMTLSDFFLFADPYKYLKIIQSMFMVPDTFNFYSIFPELDKNYPYGMIAASVALYLPFFSLAGVISYIWAKRRSWEKILLLICAVMIFVPGLNSFFYMFNHSYYARWFYMPILIMALVSVKALEENVDFKPGIISCAVVLAGLTAYWLLSDRFTLETASVKGWTDNNVNILTFAVSWITLVILFVALRAKRDKDFIMNIYVFSLISIYLCYGVMNFNAMNPKFVEDTKEVADHYQSDMTISSRIDRNERISEKYYLLSHYNLNMIWGFDSLNYGNNILESGYAEFMLTNGFSLGGKSFSFMTANSRELCDICSVKYFFAEKGSEGMLDRINIIEDFGYYNIAENEDYIPMGFTYDKYLTTKEFFEKGAFDSKGKAYMKYLVVDDPAIVEGIDALTTDAYSLPDDEEYQALIERHRQEACYNTVKSSKGLTAEIDLGAENIVFFSAAYSDGWKAYVDGAETPVLKVNNGLVGVRVPAGHHAIELSYHTPGLDAGIACSCAGLLAYAVYMFVSYRKPKKTRENRTVTES